jgi:DNA-binding YbaB/EbfC family protein
MMKLQEELKARTVEASAGGEAVKVVVNGNKELVSINIKPEAVDPEDVEMLQDLILTAVNDGLKQIDAMTEQEMSKVTGGMKIPGLG